MSKGKTDLSELQDDYLSELDAGTYGRMNNASPGLVERIRALIAAGQTPEDVARLTLYHNGAAWVETQLIRAVCRHIQRELLR